MKGKILMFAKTSLQSFVYDMIGIFCFPDQVLQKIYEKYLVDKCFMYQNLTDTDSTLLIFVFICNLDCTISKKESRKISFEGMIASKIFKKIDLSDDFWEQFNVQDKTLKKNRSVFIKSKVLIMLR